MSANTIYQHFFNHLWPCVFCNENEEKSKIVQIFHSYPKYTPEEIGKLRECDIDDLKERITRETGVLQKILLRLKDLDYTEENGMEVSMKFNNEQINLINQHLPDDTFALKEEVVLT